MTRTLDNPTDDSYFEWLVWKAQGGDSDDPSETYWCLFSLMHKTEFTWFVPNDGNRAGDGEDLRNEYSSYSTYGWANYGPCTMLELLIGLAKRMDDMIGIEPLSSILQPNTAVPLYISELLNNLGLTVNLLSNLVLMANLLRNLELTVSPLEPTVSSPAFMVNSHNSSSPEVMASLHRLVVTADLLLNLDMANQPVRFPIKVPSAIIPPACTRLCKKIIYKHSILPSVSSK